MCKAKTIVDETLKYLFIGITIIQAILGMIWLVNNIGLMPFDSVSNDYIEASKNLVVDEYMGILYALIVRLFGHGSILYVVQLVTLAFAFIYFLSGITKSPWIYLYIMTAPTVLQICCSVIPNSFVLATLLITIGGLRSFFYEKKSQTLIEASISALFGILLNRDLIFLYGAVFAITGAMLAVKKGKKWWQPVMMFALIAAEGISITVLSTKKDAFERYERTESYLIFQKVCWPELDSLNGIMNTYYDLDFYYELINAQNEPQILPGVIGYIDCQIGDASMDDILDAAVDLKLDHGFKAYLMPCARDCLCNIFPNLGLFKVFQNNISNTGVYSGIEHFYLSAPDISRVFLFFNLFSGVTLLLLGVVDFFLFRMVNKKWLICGLIIVAFEAFYYTLFTIPGFDYRNVAFAMIFWPLVFVVSSFEMNKRGQILER